MPTDIYIYSNITLAINVVAIAYNWKHAVNILALLNEITSLCCCTVCGPHTHTDTHSRATYNSLLLIQGERKTTHHHHNHHHQRLKWNEINVGQCSRKVVAFLSLMTYCLALTHANTHTHCHLVTHTYTHTPYLSHVFVCTYTHNKLRRTIMAKITYAILYSLLHIEIKFTLFH